MMQGLAEWTDRRIHRIASHALKVPGHDRQWESSSNLFLYVGTMSGGSRPRTNLRILAA